VRVSATDQRESMGLLEYQSMPSLCDIAHDGVMSTAFFCATEKTRRFYRLKIDTMEEDGELGCMGSLPFVAC
jgi:hypothetical protein